MLKTYSFTKNEAIHWCSSRILVAPSAGCFTDSHFQVGSFAKHLLWHQNYFGMDYPSFLDLPLHFALPPINTEIFSTPFPPLFSNLKTAYPTPFVNRGVGVGEVGVVKLWFDSRRTFVAPTFTKQKYLLCSL